ncbi:MAG: glutamine-synthetase adenylyltransferase [Pseudomonadota bacterium]
MPRAFDPEHGAETLQGLPDFGPDVSDLLRATGGCSPFLKTLLEQAGDTLPAFFDQPEAAFDAVLENLPEAQDPQMPEGLRNAKAHVAMMIALADLAGVWSLEEVTERLSRFADGATSVALRGALAREVKRGKIPSMTEIDAENGAGMVVLAMGKLGAGELNYSSDIDLICLFDETRFDPADLVEARAGFVRATRAMCGTLSDRTANGYVFRTDLRLRPDPSVMPVCISMAAAEAYYESAGRTWERAAFIKARPAAGDIDAGRRFLKILTPFVWRRHLDFAAIEDAHNIRLRIRSQKNTGGRLHIDGRDIKLGQGGIREIEFFTQTRQLIAGGRDPDLRAPQTVQALGQLAAKDWVPSDTADSLSGYYRMLREIEHRLQMVNDARTQTLPKSPAGWDRLSAMMGQSPEALRHDVSKCLAQVHTRTEGFFAPDAASPIPAPTVSLDEQVIARWPSYPALRSPRASSIFERLRPDILARLSSVTHPDEALRAFDAFLQGLPAGVQVFSLFEMHPALIDLLIDIAGTAPDLASYLSRNAGVFDAVIAGEFFAPWPGRKALVGDLESRLDRETDYETKLDAARRWHKEWHFRVGVHHLRQIVTADVAAAQYADLAEAVLRALWPVVCAEFARRHGAPPGRGAVILGMGSLGAGQLTAGSDLDLIVIYDAPGDAVSDGRRPLPARAYYAKATQALITALSAPMSEGRLYDVDMRLRPSGNQGPVATSWAAFQSYQSEEAWIWEHMALTRARVVAGAEALGEEIERFRLDLLSRQRPAADALAEVAAMRQRLAEAKSSLGVLDAKNGPGRMQDIELLAQAGCLVAGEPAAQVAAGLQSAQAQGLVSAEGHKSLQEAYALFRIVTQVTRLLSRRTLTPEHLGQGGARLLLAEAQVPDLSALEATLLDKAGQADDVITQAVSQYTRDDDERT